MNTLALTGGIACGKSLFGSFLAQLGADVVDTDELVHRLHAPGGEAAKAVEHAFGPEYLAPDGGTDRAKLARLVFSEPSARLRLESIVHPILRASLLAWRDAPAAPGAAPLRVAQIPLLFETGWTDGWTYTATVETTYEESRLARLRARGLTEEEARARIAAQLSASERMKRADFTILNDGTTEDLFRKAQSLYDEITRSHK